MSIHYVIGDASQPTGEPSRIIIAHVVNNVGKWGRGFTASLDKRWPWLGQQVMAEFETRRELMKVSGTLGGNVYAKTEEGYVVANMCAMKGVRSRVNPVPLDYKALDSCLRWLSSEAAYVGRDIHMPRIGVGLAGGEWPAIEKLINRLVAYRVEVYVYDLPTGGV